MPARVRSVCGKSGSTPELKLSWLSYCFCLSGSISSCDAFLNVFQTKGLRTEVICPCASSPEALTVAIRRYVNTTSTSQIMQRCAAVSHACTWGNTPAETLCTAEKLYIKQSSLFSSRTDFITGSNRRSLPGSSLTSEEVLKYLKYTFTNESQLHFGWICQAFG